MIKLNENLTNTVKKTHEYFVSWDDFATVRNKPHTYAMDFDGLQKELGQKNWFLPEGVAVLKHKALSHLGDEEKQYVMGRFLLQFLEYGTLMEHEYVNTVTAEIAFGDHGIKLPESMRLDAMKIYTDEGYHAYFTLEAAQYIREYIGLSFEGTWPLRNKRLESLRDLVANAPKEDQFLIRFGIAAVSETVAAKELTENMRGVVVKPIVNLFVDHAEDERKHCLYFSTLWEVVWAQLTENERKRLGCYLPKILKSFVSINTYPLEEALGELSVSSDVIQEVIKETYPEGFNIERALGVAPVSFRVFKKLGIFDYPSCREAFIKEGFPAHILH